MELFFLRHTEYERLYNCTGLDIDSIPLAQRLFVPESIVICVLCAIYYILYVPCLYSIWKHLRDNSCYKLLFYIGITDLAILWIIGFFSGWLNLRGAVFCSYPTTIYFVGVTITSIWNAESSADLILAFNRCVDIISPNLSRVLFSGRRTSFWIIGCSMYALYWALFIQPGVYSSLHFGWFFNPFIGYRNVDIYQVSPCSKINLSIPKLGGGGGVPECMQHSTGSGPCTGVLQHTRSRNRGALQDFARCIQQRILSNRKHFESQSYNSRPVCKPGGFPYSTWCLPYENSNYENKLHLVHNIGVAFLSPLIYLIFGVKLFYDIRKNQRAVVSEMSAVQIRTFLQVFLISLLNSWTGVIYVYMQYNKTDQWMITLAEFAWLHVHGFPSVIYLALNKTIREDCRMLYMKLFKRHRISYIGGITVYQRPIVNVPSRNSVAAAPF